MIKGQGKREKAGAGGLKSLLHRSLFIFCCVLAAAAGAQQYPERPIRLIVGFPPGGAADILGRIAAQQLTDALGQQVVVDNRGGAGGLIATEIAAKATADGYTLLFTSIPHVINPHLYRKVRYHPIRDFAPVVQFVAVPLMMAAHPQLAARSVADVISTAKANPGGLNYGSGGSGSSGHLAMELFKSMAGVDITHIPYKGVGPMITDMLGGQVRLTISSAVPLSPQIRGGRLRGLGVTSPKRSPAFPDLPAIAETVPGYEVINWFGILAPKGAPAAAIRRVNEALNQAIRSPELRKMLIARTADAVGGTPDDFARVIRADFEKWGRVVKASGARVD